MSHPEPVIKIAVIQPTVGDQPDRNQAHAMELVTRAAEKGANMICLPELYRTHYFCRIESFHRFDLAIPTDHASLVDMASLARRLGVVLIVPFFERAAPGLYYNSALIFDADGSAAGHYRKTHIPDDPGYYEKYYFAPGDLGIRAFDTAFGRIAVLVCWDQWYPEAARLAALDGAEILFYPTAIGWHPSEKERYGAVQRDAWMTVQRGHAIANACYVAAANRVGFEQSEGDPAGIEFWGTSFVAGPQGEVLACAGDTDEAVLCVEIDRAAIETVRRNWPFLRDRRVDLYGELIRRWRR